MIENDGHEAVNLNLLLEKLIKEVQIKSLRMQFSFSGSSQVTTSVIISSQVILRRC